MRSFSLSPVAWKRMICHAETARRRGEITIPAGCPSIWSIRTLRCQIGHALVRRRSDGWLMQAAQNSVTRLTEQNRQRGIPTIPIKARRLLNVYTRLVFQWTVMAEMEADARIAQVLGSSAVAAWIYQTQAACSIIPKCLRQIVELAVGRGLRVPIHAVCAAHYDFMAPIWGAIMESERILAQRSKAGNALRNSRKTGRPAPLEAAEFPSYMAARDTRQFALLGRMLLMRLAALPGGPGTAEDPRPAATLLEDIDSVEEKLLRREAGLGAGALRRMGMGELGDALLPGMREEVARNASVLEGRSMVDFTRAGTRQAGAGRRLAGRSAPPFEPAATERPGARAAGFFSGGRTGAQRLAGGLFGTSRPDPGAEREKISPYWAIMQLGSGNMTREAFLELVNGGTESGRGAL